MDKWHIVQRRCWIFDLDGTLTRPQHDFAAIKKALDVPEDCYILEHLDTLGPVVGRQKRRELDRIETDLAKRSIATRGAVQLVEKLVAQRCHMGIITRNSRDNALISLEQIGLSEHFSDAFVIGRDEEALKPSPAGVRRLLRDWGVGPVDTVFVGDYVIDLQTAQAAGVGAIHLDSNGRFPWPEYTDLGISCLTELIEQDDLAIKTHFNGNIG